MDPDGFRFLYWASFFYGEGPRSRCYGRTAAIGLIVQPYDEDEEKDDFFFHFSK
jgi:hypothetical protein